MPGNSVARMYVLHDLATFCPTSASVGIAGLSDLTRVPLHVGREGLHLLNHFVRPTSFIIRLHFIR